jgi:hypothetical protein
LAKSKLTRQSFSSRITVILAVVSLQGIAI